MSTPARQFSRARPAAPPQTPRPATPFDYAFRYELLGQTGRVINNVINISVEASFTAVSIGYGVIPKVETIIFGPPPRPGNIIAPPPPPKPLGQITIDDILSGLKRELDATFRALPGQTGPEAVLLNGIKLNSDAAEFALQSLGRESLPPDISRRLFQVVGSPSELIQFKYAIFDEGSGREFQSEPILNIAGLGSANGDRPFRYFAQPIVFPPRATIRMEITEISDFKGELHVSLHGYRVLGAGNSPTSATARRTGRRR